jgi:hypothetical protein
MGGAGVESEREGGGGEGRKGGRGRWGGRVPPKILRQSFGSEGAGAPELDASHVQGLLDTAATPGMHVGVRIIRQRCG